MFKKALFLSLFLFTVLILTPSNTQAADSSALNGLNQTAGVVDAFSEQVKNNNSLITKNFIQTKAGEIIGTVLSFVGVLFLMLTIYAGIMWMTAQGNEQQVTKAKDLLINSIIGIVIIFAAYAITAFVGNFISQLGNQ